MKVGNQQPLQNVGLNQASDKSQVKGLEKSLEGAGKNSSIDRPDGLSGSSRVAVSSKAQAMAKAKEIASNQDVDEARIAKLQSMIDAGKYKVDAKAVADSMVDEHLKTMG